MREIYFLLITLVITGCAEKKELLEGLGDEEVQNLLENKSVKTLVFYSKVEVVGRNQPPHIVAAKDRLDFGKLPQGMVEKKEILLENNKKKEVLVNPVANGSIAKWITFENNEFRIPAEGNVKQNIYLSIPNDAEPGNYTGYVTFMIREV
ncbi:MAG TPA: hypothetical protein EYP30_06780 [Archaeoglobaceae archaeon]|nr:hypothetical protein [Archaeoglobaceae archaeon]